LYILTYNKGALMARFGADFRARAQGEMKSEPGGL
jgi:hypothetical protein